MSDDYENESDYSEDDEAEDVLTVTEATGADRNTTDDANEHCEDDSELGTESSLSTTHSQTKKKIFYQQKLPPKLRHLPYFDRLEVESETYFAEIKSGISNSILLRDLRTSLVHWCHELNRYINSYTRHYTIEDAVAIIKALYEVISIDELDLRIVRTVACVMSTMLKKTHTISRNDLQLEWRPLFKIYSYVRFRQLEEHGILLLPKDIQKQLEILISNARVYFHAESTKEIMSEVRPLLCQYDSIFPRGLLIANLFLPTLLTVEEHNKCGAGLWFDELWAWYERQVVPAKPPSVSLVLPKLFARLAVDCPGYVNWSQPKYCEPIFRHLMRSINIRASTHRNRFIPIGSQKIDLPYVTKHIVYMFGGKDGQCVIDHLCTLFDAIDSFFHPSNMTRDLKTLLVLMQHLAWNMCLRLRRELYHTHSNWIVKIPEEKKLTQNDVDAFVKIVLPRCLMSIFAKENSQIAISTLRYLGQLSPRLTVTAVIEKFDDALTSLIEPHRLVQLMSALSAIGMTIMRYGANSSSPHFPPAPATNVAEIKVTTKAKKKSTAMAPANPIDKDLRLHVIPLMNSFLPALDVNDINKTGAAFSCLTLFCSLMPFVDCSEAVHMRNDLSKNEKELCGQTAMLEEFVDQLISRIFTFIEQIASNQSTSTSASNNDGGNAAAAQKNRMSASIEETVMKFCSTHLVSAILMNCSTAFAKLIGERTLKFVKENEFTNKIAASCAGDIIIAVLKTYPSVYWPKFYEFVSTKLKKCLTDECLKAEEVDNTTMWLLNLLPSVLGETRGDIIYKYHDDMIELLRRLSMIRCRAALNQAALAIENLLKAKTNIKLKPRIEMREKNDRPLDQYLPIREWAACHDKKNFNPQWDMPDLKNDKPFVDKLLATILYPTMANLANDDLLADKELLLSSITIVGACYSGIGYWMPMLEGPFVQLSPSNDVHKKTDYNIVSTTLIEKDFTLYAPDGGNMREYAYNFLELLCQRMQKVCPNDAKSFQKLIGILLKVIYQRGVSPSFYNSIAKFSKEAVTHSHDIIRGSLGLLDAAAYEHIYLAHEYRRVLFPPYAFSQTHLRCMQLLFTLSTSHYSRVRQEAQHKLDAFMNNHPYSYMYLAPRLVHIFQAHRPDDKTNDKDIANLQVKTPPEPETQLADKMDLYDFKHVAHIEQAIDDSAISHQQFKGAIFTLLLGGKIPIIVRHNWHFLRQLWPAISRAYQGEKPSVIMLISLIEMTIVEKIESFYIQSTVNDASLERARALIAVQDTHALPKFAEPSIDEQKRAIDKEKERNKTNRTLYYELFDDLFSVLEKKNDFHWRQVELACIMMNSLLRKDMTVPTKCAMMIFKMVNDDTLRVRKSSLKAFNAYLKMTRPPAVKIGIKPPAGIQPASEIPYPVRSGIRKDNFEYMIFRADNLPHNDSKTFDDTLWLDKAYHLLYCWPDTLKCSAPSSNQAPRQRPYEQLDEHEKAIVDLLFEDKTNAKLPWLKKFEQLYTLEENKGSEKFNLSVSGLVEQFLLVANTLVLPKFQEIAERLVTSSKETEQRLTMEIITGVSKGSRHFKYEDAIKVEQWLTRMFKIAINNLTNETALNWSVCTATLSGDVDPRRLHWLYDVLFEACTGPTFTNTTAFTQCSRLTLLHGLICQGEWRVPSLYHRLLKEVAMPLILDSHCYQNVRSRLGRMLESLSQYDSPYIYYDEEIPVQYHHVQIQTITNLFNDNLTRTWALVNSGAAPSDDAASASSSAVDLSAMETNMVNDEQVDKQERHILKVYLDFVYQHVATRDGPLHMSVLATMPLILYFENDTSDEELRKQAENILFLASIDWLTEKQATAILDIGDQIMVNENQWWKVCASLCAYLEIVAFTNLYLFKRAPFNERLRGLVHMLLRHERLDVRLAAKHALHGLIMCRVWAPDDALMIAKYKSWTSKSRPFTERHAGVLALCALVQSAPYTVPAYLPDIIVHLAPFMSAEHALQTAVRTTMSDFKRTHQDSWHETKNVFTEEQLEVLRDLTVSPSYYV